MPKILFAEDDTDFAKLVVDWLELEMYSVECVENGKDAMQLLRSFHYDAAVLDWNLPEMSGVEICRGLRRDGSKLPIIMLTGRKTTEDTLEGTDAEAECGQPGEHNCCTRAQSDKWQPLVPRHKDVIVGACSLSIHLSFLTSGISQRVTPLAYPARTHLKLKASASLRRQDHCPQPGMAAQTKR